MKVTNIMALTILALGALRGTAFCEDNRSYQETVKLIKETMTASTSLVRKESYGYLRFDGCTMSYDVSGTYPVGDLYHIRFNGIDFASLNPAESKTGHDYTAFLRLNFGKEFQYQSETQEIKVHTAVINLADDAKRDLLFGAFLHLGELCGAGKAPR